MDITDQAVVLISEVQFVFTSQYTFYARNNNKYYIKSMISTVQLILFFGDASAIFQNYSVYVRFHSENVKTITDQGREKDLVEKNLSRSSKIGRRAARYINECDCRLRR